MQDPSASHLNADDERRWEVWEVNSMGKLQGKETKNGLKVKNLGYDLQKGETELKQGFWC